MSVLFYPLFFLPIHRHSRKEYYEEHDKWVKPQKEGLKEQYGKPFNQLSHETQVGWEMCWYWPPWKFNDIVGYLDIGMDGGDCMIADIYLKRKWLPRYVKHRTTDCAYTATRLDVKKNHGFFRYRALDKIRVGIEDNDSYLIALNKILDEAKRILEKRRQKFQLWLPPFNFDCVDFAKAYQQIKDERSKEEET